MEDISSVVYRSEPTVVTSPILDNLIVPTTMCFDFSYFFSIQTILEVTVSEASKEGRTEYYFQTGGSLFSILRKILVYSQYAPSRRPVNLRLSIIRPNVPLGFDCQKIGKIYQIGVAVKCRRV